MSNRQNFNHNFATHFAVVLLCILSVSLQGQESKKNSIPAYKIEKDSTYYSDYESLKQAHVNMESTPEAKYAVILSKEYFGKWKGAYDGTDLGQRGEDLKWIKENLAKTKFSTYDEAVQQRDALNEATTRSMTTPEGQVMSALAMKLISIYGPQIYIDVVSDVLGVGPAPQLDVKLPNKGHIDTTSKDYKERYKKLRELAVIYFDLPSVVNARKLQYEFQEKCQVPLPNVNKDEPVNNRLEWLKTNWQKTKFRSYEQAKKEYEIMLTAQGKMLDDYKARDYRDYLAESIHLYGSGIMHDLQKDFEKNYPGKFYY